MKPLFSVVLIARNEEKTLPALLSSLREFRERGGEVVLMDTGSTDNTAELARGLGCRVFEEGNRFTHTITKQTAHDINERFVVAGEAPIVKEGDRMFDYANARNHAAAYASCDMVAMPDCDEQYTRLDIDSIDKAIRDGFEQLEYNFVFAHDAHGGELVKFLHSKFYDRRKLKWVGIIHEVLQGDARRLQLGEDVIKLEHWQNPETDRIGYLKGLALAVVNEPNNDRNAHYFGRELLYRGRPKSAIKQLEAHIQISPWAEERSQSQVHIGEAYMGLGDAQKAIHAWIDSFDTCPRRREGLMKIAEYYYQNKSAQHALSYASAALAIPPGNFYANFQPYYEHYPHEIMYWALWHLDRKVEARHHHREALRFQPHNAQYLHDYRLFTEHPLVSIVVPTLREGGLKRLLESVDALVYPKDKIELITIPDVPRIGVARRLKEGVERSKGEWIVYAADDMEFTPTCIIEALLDSDRHGAKLVAFNSGPVSQDKGNICEHFLLHRSALEGLPRGEIFDTDFRHVGVDNLLWARMEKAGEAVRSEHARIIHHHFSKGSEMDDVHRMAWAPEDVEHDRALLAEKLAGI